MLLELVLDVLLICVVLLLCAPHRHASTTVQVESITKDSEPVVEASEATTEDVGCHAITVYVPQVTALVATVPLKLFQEVTNHVVVCVADADLPECANSNTPSCTPRPTRRTLLKLAKEVHLKGYSRMSTDDLYNALTLVKVV